MTDALPVHPIDATIATIDDITAIRTRRVFAASIEAVWAAITHPAALERWAPFAPDRDLDQPGPVHEALLGTDLSSEEEVLEVVNRRLLRLTWGDDQLLFTLGDAGEDAPSAGGDVASSPRTALTLVHATQQREITPMMAAGWHVSLRALDGQLRQLDTPDVAGEAAFDHGWHEAHEVYAAQLAASAGADAEAGAGHGGGAA